MNMISNVSSMNVNSRNNNPSFRGALGEKFVSKMAKGETVIVDDVMNAVKGTFGPKSEKVADVVESLLGRVQVLTQNNEANIKARNLAENKLADVPRQLNEAKSMGADSVREDCARIIRAKNEELAAKDAELKAAKEYAAKYEPMAKVKSFEELDTVMPDKAIETIQEMVTHKTESADSMFNFLLTGKGQEAALAQIERSNVMLKAHQDGITKIPDVEKAIETAQKESGVYAGGHPMSFALNLISSALHGNPKASYLESRVIRQQVEDNAMGLLQPLCDNRYYNTAADYAKAELGKTIDESIEFHRNFAEGKAKLLEQYKNGDITETVVPYDNNKSIISIKENDGNAWDITFWQVSNRGASNW
ncbi:MAG: hypothetical protein NC200_07585 [Candidatus Gastranaerophilales bacterium]|nr:hypothetical protein [Candidatus Gastranaerophilales bacterium]